MLSDMLTNILKWGNEYIDRLIVDDKPILLVPKKNC